MNTIHNFLTKAHNKQYETKTLKEVAQIRDAIYILKNKTDEELHELFVKEKLSHSNLRDKLITVYAIATILIERLYKLKLYDVQLQGAIALFDNNIAEMKTGEGKTITSALPVILKALSGESVHVVTVNEYLSKRDKEYLEPLYKKLGFTVGLNSHSNNFVVKKREYEADILYSTASELGFDYLRDNMIVELDNLVNKRGYNFAIIDEIDLVLIDEARTPLIIGKGEPDNIGVIIQAQNIVSKLQPEDYEQNFQSKSVTLTKSGEAKVNNAYRIDNIYNEQHVDKMYRINRALLANFMYKYDVDYTVTKTDGVKEITIIDSFTGRLYQGRRFSQGLHQAIEAKHSKDGVQVKEENKTVATITLQNFFRLYKNLAGMSGTAIEEQNEFFEIYGLNVVQIKPNKPLLREDKPIKLFTTADEKWKHLITEIKKYHAYGDPVLVGTVSVEDSETVSKLLKEQKIKHSVLNAKQDANEANIIAKAGKKGAITIATNMAGRGTDIIVDNGFKLVVFLTELNESKRIDNQLKGRTSRQGAQGVTETLISLEDSLFGRTKNNTIKNMKVVNPLPPFFGKALTLVQEELESSAYSARRASLKYDDVIREQRELFYQSRRNVLEANSLDKLKSFYPNSLNLDFKEMDNSMKERFLRHLILYALDTSWVEHINKLDVLKNGIGWRGQNGNNPIITYQNEAQELYDDFVVNVKNIIKDKTPEYAQAIMQAEFKNAYESEFR